MEAHFSRIEWYLDRRLSLSLSLDLDRPDFLRSRDGDLDLFFVTSFSFGLLFSLLQLQ